MERLDASHREILLMRTQLNLSYEEIATNLGINVGTVKSRVNRARAQLKRMLLGDEPQLAAAPRPERRAAAEGTKRAMVI